MARRPRRGSPAEGGAAKLGHQEGGSGRRQHCGVENGGPCNEHNGLGAVTTCPGAPCQGAFHTYALEWSRGGKVEELRWYVDGKNYHTIRSSDVAAKAWADATHGSMTIIFNV